MKPDLATLLDAVPSFGPRWKAWCVDQAEYVARFPEERRSEAEVERELLTRLAWHMGKQVAAGERHEVGWLFAALETILAKADQETWDVLTVGFLESLIHAVEREGGDAAPLGGFATGRAAREAWRNAFKYTHPPDEHSSLPREGLSSTLTARTHMSSDRGGEIDEDAIDEAVLALMFLTLHGGGRAWKSFDWDALNRLHEKGFIGNPVSKAKSVQLTEEGEAEARRLFEKLFVRLP